MAYDFDEIILRRHSNSYKWDLNDSEDLLPMWVADMDFRTAPPVVEALIKRVEHGIFGYAKVPQSYFDAVMLWFEQQHGFGFQKEQLLFTTGVVPALSAIIKALAVPGDQIIVQEPVYNCFFSSIRNNGCEIISNDLLYDKGRYTINFEDLEKKASDPRAKLMLLCNPHNPVGRAWTKEELCRIGEICIAHGVFVVSDEIHCDLVHNGHKHTAFGSISQEFLKNSATCISPSKAFNLAGVQVANILAADQQVRSKIDRALNVNEVCEISPFAVEALIAAYSHGAGWLAELKVYLYANYLYLKEFFAEHLPGFKVIELQATYLVWIDCSALNKSSVQIAALLLENQHLKVNQGTLYGSAGEHFIRINIACPRLLLAEGLERIRKAFLNP